jgi:hypothetical protein
MRLLRSVFESCQDFVRANPIKLGEIEIFRQGTPWDECDAEAMEELAAQVSESHRIAELQAWGLTRN